MIYNGNKGEWSELYAFLKIIGDGFVNGADENLNQIDGWKYPVEKVLRDSLDKLSLVYNINSDLGVIEIHSNNTCLKAIQQNEVIEQAHRLLAALQSKQTAAFKIPEAETFLNDLYKPKMKAASASKRDITLVIKDLKNRLEKEVGFSIKSKLGGAPTLFNAGKGTNFEYDVVGLENCSTDVIEKAKKLKISPLIAFLYQNGCTIKYSKTKHIKFLNNLMIIDSMLDKIMATLTRAHYMKKGNVRELVDYVQQENPCDYQADVVSTFYQYKVKQFLSAAALGMTALSNWEGHIDATGGYLVVKENGELLCYHIYNWNALQEYLYKSTKLETASTTRHDFGYLYKEADKFKIDLNLQVRFL